MAKLSLLFSLSVCFLLLFHAQARRQQSQGQGQYQQCQLQNIDALEPTRKIQSEAGVTEHWDDNNEQLDCAGVSVTRYVIEPRGLLLPHFHNAPKLTYVIQGRGIHGAAIPGCPETYQSQQSSRQSEQQQSQQEQGQNQQEQAQNQQSYRHGDRHQKVRPLKQGDLVAIPVGVANWFYNDGDTRLVLVSLLDTSNNENQLDDRRRTFYLGGNPQQGRQQGSSQGAEQESSPYGHKGTEQESSPYGRGTEQESSPYGRGTEQESSPYSRGTEQESSSNNILNFAAEVLADVFGISTETARKLKGENDDRGSIVRVENELQVIRPPRVGEEPRAGEERAQPGDQNEEQSRQSDIESFCNVQLRINIDKPSSADVYNPRAGRITRVNSRKLSILNDLRLNVERGVLYRNALLAPHWNLNAHSVIYATRGDAEVQIVGTNQQPIYSGRLRKNQLLIVPQNFAVVIRAGDQGFEWVSFKTNDNAIVNSIAGRNSVIQALPEGVLTNAFRISSEEARQLKYNRDEEKEVFAPRSESQRRDYASA